MNHGQAKSPWTEEVDARLKAHASDRHSAAQIAELLCREFPAGNFSRSAIIGRCHRKGIALLGTPPRPPRVRTGGGSPPRAPRPKHTPAPAPRQRVSRFGTPLPPPEPLKPRLMRGDLGLDVPIEQRRSLLELRHDDCRFPFGNPATDNFFFCGALAAPGRPYCPDHCRLAYRKRGEEPVDEPIEATPESAATAPRAAA